MKFSSTIAAAILMVTSVAAAVLPEPDKESGLTKRQDNGVWCGKRVDGDSTYYELTTWGDWDDDWGHGFLDNLRGHCGQFGNIENWGFNYESGAPPTNGHAHFNAGSVARDTNCVEDALWDASKATGAIWDVHCNWF